MTIIVDEYLKPNSVLLDKSDSTFIKGLFRVSFDIYCGNNLSDESAEFLDQIVPQSYGLFFFRGETRIYPETSCPFQKETVLEIIRNDPRGIFNRRLRCDHSPHEEGYNVFAAQLGRDMGGRTIVIGLSGDEYGGIYDLNDDSCYDLIIKLRRFYEEFSASRTISDMISGHDRWQFIASRDNSQFVFAGKPIPGMMTDGCTSNDEIFVRSFAENILTAGGGLSPELKKRIKDLKMANFRLADNEYILVSFGLNSAETADHDDNDRLIGGFAHKIKNSLGALQTAASQLSLQYGEVITDDDLSLIRIIESSAENITGIVERFGTYSTCRMKSCEPVDLGNIISGLVTRFRRDNNTVCDILLIASDTPVFIAGDRDQIETAVAELLDNACLSGREHGPIRVTLKKEIDTIFLTIENGMAPSDRRQKMTAETIMEPFISTQNNRAGMGLPIARKVIADHGGTLGVDNSIKTRFSVMASFPGVESREEGRGR